MTLALQQKQDTEGAREQRGNRMAEHQDPIGALLGEGNDVKRRMQLDLAFRNEMCYMPFLYNFRTIHFV